MAKRRIGGRVGRPINYQAYLDKRKEFEAKGYILDEAQTEAKYKEHYRNAADLGQTNITYYLAKSDIAISRNRAKELIKLINKPTKEQIASGLSAKAKSLFGGKKHITQKDVMTVDLLNDAIITCPADAGKVAVSNRQALFYLIWEQLGNKENAEGWFGY